MRLTNDHDASGMTSEILKQRFVNKGCGVRESGQHRIRVSAGKRHGAGEYRIGTGTASGSTHVFLLILLLHG